MAFDPDEFLKDQKPKESTAPATGGFDPDKFLASPDTNAEPAFVADIQTGPAEPGTPMETAPVPSATSIPVPGSDYSIPFQPPVVNPAGAGLMSQIGGTALGQEAAAMAANAGRIAQPYVTTAGKVMSAYANNPLTKLAPDIGAVSMGMVPPYATSQAIGATQGAYNIARQTPGAVATAAPPPTTTQVSSNPMLAEIAKRQAAAEAETIANRTVIQKIAMSKVMQMAAPALNTAARVAGPAGLAYNAYEAGNMARETQLGPRLAQGQGGAAEQAFRQRNTVYGNNNQITADQARAVLSGGSARDIQSFGGTDFLRKRALGQ